MNGYQTLVEKAREYGNSGQWNECIGCYEDAFNYYQDEILIGDLLDLALAYVEIKDKEKGYSIIQDVIEYDGDISIAYHYLGYYYLKINEAALALQAFLNAKELGDDSVECYFNIGLLYDEAEEYDKAVEYYKKVLDKDENNFYANLNLGAIFQQENKLEESYQLVSRIKKLYPDMHLVNYNLGVLYGLWKDYEKARECYYEELTKENFCKDAYYNLAIIYKDIDKDYLKAKELYLKGLEDNKDDFKCWYNLGCIHCLLDDFDSACDSFYCAYLINNKVIKYISEDEELVVFRNSKAYENLKNKIEL